MGLYENIARLKEANLCNIVLVPFRLSASGRNKLYYHYYITEPYLDINKGDTNNILFFIDYITIDK